MTIYPCFIARGAVDFHMSVQRKVRYIERNGFCFEKMPKIYPENILRFSLDFHIGIICFTLLFYCVDIYRFSYRWKEK